MKGTQYAIFGFLCLLFTSCAPQEAKQEVSFYYWQSKFWLSDANQQILDSMGVDKLYVKFMDVDMEGGYATPVAPIRFAESRYLNYEIIPCVFITNRTFQSENVNPERLAERVWDYLQQICGSAGIQPDEYQFDCDWTPSTRQAYFAFLHTIRNLKKEALLSSTLRLHQYRYPEQAGVPPVDKVALMYYNMGDIEDVEEPNSILNNEKGQPYLEAGAYPLELDVALPAFSWLLVYRLGELDKIIKAVQPDSLMSMEGIEKTGENTFLVKQNLYFGGHYLNEGDRLRFEAPSEDALEEAAQALNKIENQSGTLLFYHLDETMPKRYPPGFYRRIADLYFE